MKNKTSKRKLWPVVAAGAALLLAGTFAWTSFSQRALNDIEGQRVPEHGGRIHDQFDRDSGNKDIFAENYGQDTLFVRIKLKEYMEVAGQPVDADPTVDPDDSNTWTTFIPGPATGGTDATDDRQGPRSSLFNDYWNWNLGMDRVPGMTMYFMPTFNLDPNNFQTAAAGDARDFLIDGVTHPGDGTEGFWQTGNTANSIRPVGEETGDTHTATPVLTQDRAPLTAQQWLSLSVPARGVGQAWIIDQESGWAYFAMPLESGEATPYLLDDIAQTPEFNDNLAANFPGASEHDWRYSIHVIGEFVSFDDLDQFLAAPEDDTTAAQAIVAHLENQHTPQP
ncbi:MAG TPA: hypothetical protein DCZ00_06270 [Lactococcus sp.]|uniref:hypothetical protein n=1 Tax=Lactococcus TaxID=1357 RepID=UPI000E8E7933|nr:MULTISPECIES: hypothetical protein [Lactococcus]HAP14814.1 hypothetical protein [Lactococcus sp.]HBC91032.1 hypothetical protein [Lactococcus sp.]